MSNELGKYIKEKRGKKSLRDFASLIGISHSHLDSIEKGIDPKTNKPVSISVEVLKKLSDATNTEYQFLSELYFYDLEFAEIQEKIENGSFNIEEVKNNNQKMINMILKKNNTSKEQDEVYKQILRDKGLMDDNDNINEEDFKKLIDFAVANKDFIINKKDKD